MKWEFYIIVLNVVILTRGLGPLDDPYKILGVKKSATVQELRKAYKKLAKEWHPDKNDDPAAAGKFVEVTQAYELLTDPERRKQYDNHGIINPDGSHRTREQNQFDEFDPFDDFFNFPAGFKFNLPNYFYKLSVTSRAFENNLLPKSFWTPYLILFFSDWCCTHLQPMWKKAVEELEPVGIKLATVHVEEEQVLARKCGVGSVPAIVLLINGKIYVYKDPVFSIQKIVHFIRSKFPYKMIVNVKDDNLNSFLAGWHDNRVRALFFEKNDTIRLRYLLMAFYYKERVFFGFVRLGAPDTAGIQKKYKVSSELDTLLLFNENVNQPVASLSMSVIPIQTMKDIITANEYLILPRLSSQKVMESLCPSVWDHRRKRLCVVLVCEDKEEHDQPRQAMRQLAQEFTYNLDRVRFSYIYQEKQQEFINSLWLGGPGETILKVVVIWRRDASHIKYEWIEGSWISKIESPEWNKTKEKLVSTLSKLLSADETLTYEAVVQELIDEQAQGLIGKIITKFLVAADIVKDNISKENMLIALSAISTVICIVAVGYFMAYLVRQEEEKIKQFENQNGYQKMNSSTSNGGSSYTPQLRLHELRAERYNGMVRLLKPGCRTIVLLLDSQSRDTLLPEFHTIIWPYRKNKTLMFGYMFIDKGLEWYKRLLTLSLPEPRQLDINPRNCIGTVLSLNGHRKYFCMYHAKHPECFKGRGSKRMLKMTKSLNGSANVVNKIGSFMGFEESSNSDSEDSVDLEQGTRVLIEDFEKDILLQSNLLKGLANWLDRLFEGSTHRYYINYWPDFPTK